MKRRLVLTAGALGCALGTVAALYLGRITAYYLMSRLFTAMNMTAETYTAAPAWLVFIWNNTETLGNITALLVGSCALLYLRTLFPQTKTRLMGSHIVLGLAGALAGVALVRLLVSLDCVREGLGGSSGATEYLEDILICAVFAMAVRECICEAVYRAWGAAMACVVSGLTEAGIFWAVGGLVPVLIINGLLMGAILEYVFVRQKTICPEVFLCAGLRIGARRLAGFPGTKVYPVSETPLTGGSNGIEGALLLTMLMLLAALVFICIKRKTTSYEEKTAVSCKSVRRPKKG